MTMDECLKINRELWDALARIHFDSEFYDVKGFLDGKQTLDPVELEELPSIPERTILHLMCHFGLDTLSLARLGGIVTGVDFSEQAIGLARSLSETTKLDARFICSDVYRLPDVLDETFDIVFTSGGVLAWLPDLTKWAQIINRFLKPSGVFYIREFHPFEYIFNDEEKETILTVRYPYFQDEKPQMFENEGSYADRSAKTDKKRSYEWNHPLSRIINVLINEGLRIEFLHEFPFSSYKALPFMVESSEGRWVLPDHAESVPLMFSIKATKPE